MADFFRGLSGGFQTGLQFGEAVRRRKEYEEELAQREKLRGIFEGQPTVTPGAAATPEQIQSAGLETGRMQLNDIADFGLSAQEAERYAPQMPTAGAMTSPTTYSFGGLTQQRPFTEDELDRMKMRQAISVLAPRNTAEAMRLRSTLRAEERQAARDPLELELLGAQISGQRGAESRAAGLYPLQQQLLQGNIEGAGLTRDLSRLQIAQAQRAAAQTQAFDQGLVELNKKEFETPDDRAKALIDLVTRTQGPQAAAALQSTTTANQLSELALGAQRLSTGFNEAFRRGPDAVMEWVDKQNPNFTLKREGNNLLITYADGRTEKQEFKSTNDLMSYFAAQGSPSNFLTYQNNLMQRQNEAERIEVMRDAYNARTPEQKVEQFKILMKREPTEDERKIILGVSPKEKPVPELSPVDMKRLESANRVIEERAKLSNGRISDADRAAIYLSFGLDPSRVGMTGLPNVQQGGAGGAGGGGATTTPAQAPGLTRTAPVGSGLSSIVSQPPAPTRDSTEAGLVQRAAERGLARDELRSIYRAEVEQLGLTADTAKGLTPQRARELRNSPYFEFFPRDVKRALTDRAGR